MSMNRRAVLRIIPAVAGGALAAPADLFASTPKLSLDPAGEFYKPLQELTLHGTQAGTLLVSDGASQAYVREPAQDPFRFKIGGALGTHTVSVLDSGGATIASLTFNVDCSTEIHDAGGVFHGLLTDALWTMMDWNQEAPVNVIRYQNRVYQLFVNWIFDHTLTLKGMKYYWPELKDAVDFFAETQREDGMIWENCYPSTPEANYFDWKFSYGNFVRRIENGFRQLRRAPVESHVEQFFLEAFYYTWKATGDDAWMKAKLDCAIKAVRYVMSDPYRWSKKYQLVRRGYTIDTWDYTSDDQQKVGDDCVFVVHLDESEFGIFYGDNTNLIVGCRRLAEMLHHAAHVEEAREFLALADTLQERLDKLAWNGNFYTHWIAENPDYHPDLGVDTSQQVSLSNAYSLNREISRDKCAAIIRSYQRIRREMPVGSAGEFYGIYPPFQKGFTQNQPGLVWEYVNGGVLTVVAAELALGALEHGFEEYGVDILRREKAMADRYRGYLPATLRGKGVETPRRSFQKLDLLSIANAGFAGSKPGVLAWADDPGHGLANLPGGAQEFHGVPFDVIDPRSNGYRACIGLSQAAGYAPKASLPVHTRANSVYLLHAAGGAEQTVGTLTMRYTDGTAYSEYIESGKNVGPSWEPRDSKYSREGPRTRDRLRLAWHTTSHGFPETGVYAAGFNNPHPEREIASLDFAASPGDSRWMVLAATLSDAPVFFPPYDDLSSGIPDGWSAAMVYALVEGLAGVRDDGVAFSRTRLAPRWEAAEVHAAEVTVRYPASKGYCRYRYDRDVSRNRVTVEFTASGKEVELQILLPKSRQLKTARLDGRRVSPTTNFVEHSKYAVVKSLSTGAHRLELELS